MFGGIVAVGKTTSNSFIGHMQQKEASAANPSKLAGGSLGLTDFRLLQK